MADFTQNKKHEKKNLLYGLELIATRRIQTVVYMRI